MLESALWVSLGKKVSLVQKGCAMCAQWNSQRCAYILWIPIGLRQHSSKQGNFAELRMPQTWQKLSCSDILPSRVRKERAFALSGKAQDKVLRQVSVLHQHTQLPMSATKSVSWCTKEPPPYSSSDPFFSRLKSNWRKSVRPSSKASAQRSCNSAPVT